MATRDPRSGSVSTGWWPGRVAEAPQRLRKALRGSDGLGTTEVVVMEVVAGGRDEVHRAQLLALLAACTMLPVGDLDTFLGAADLYRVCRRRGEPVRRLKDCLVAAVAIREQVPVLHHDRDFEALARHTPLALVR
ncbi:MAG: type II toxin-antitoxin system VapC family toxin [Acidimicrobiales bacterium]